MPRISHEAGNELAWALTLLQEHCQASALRRSWMKDRSGQARCLWQKRRARRLLERLCPTKKECHECRITLPLEEFYFRGDKLNRQSMCIKCFAAFHRDRKDAAKYQKTLNGPHSRVIHKTEASFDSNS